MLSKVVIISQGQTITATGDDPVIHIKGDEGKVAFTKADGKITESTIRRYQLASKVQTIQWGSFGFILTHQE